MRWPWSRPETRESYTDQVISRIMASAIGSSDGKALGVSEACARWWSSGLSSASVSPDTPALAALTPSVLACIGRELFHRGESLFTINVIGGQVRLIPVSSFHVEGSPDPSSWKYVCQLSGPSQTLSRTLQAQAVLHFQYAPSPTQPWRGQSPLTLARSTTGVAAALETALDSELGFQLSQMISPKSRSEFGMDSAIAS